MKVQVGPDKFVEGEVVGFIPFLEPWAEYHLEDGSVLRFRATAYRILRLEERQPDGQPNYVVQHNAQVVTNDGKK